MKPVAECDGDGERRVSIFAEVFCLPGVSKSWPMAHCCKDAGPVLSPSQRHLADSRSVDCLAVDRVREQNYVGIRAWVHPKRGSGKAGVAKATDGKDHASRRGQGRIDIPAKAAQILPRDRRIVRSEQRICCVRSLCDGFSGGIVRCFELLRCMSGLLRSRHQLQSRLRQRKLARTARKPIKQGLRKDADIVCRREHAGMPGHSAHAPRRRVMHRAPKQVIKIGILARIGSALFVTCCRCDARQETGAPGTCRTSNRHPIFWRGSPGNRSSDRRVRTTCLAGGR